MLVPESVRVGIAAMVEAALTEQKKALTMGEKPKAIKQGGIARVQVPSEPDRAAEAARIAHGSSMAETVSGNAVAERLE